MVNPAFRGAGSPDVQFLYSVDPNPAHQLRQEYERWAMYGNQIPDHPFTITIVTTSPFPVQNQYFQLTERPHYRIGLDSLVDLEGTMGGRLLITAIHTWSLEVPFLIFRTTVVTAPMILQHMVVDEEDCIPFQCFDFNGARPLRYPRIAYLAVPLAYVRFPQTPTYIDILRQNPKLQDACNIPHPDVINPVRRALSRCEQRLRRRNNKHPYHIGNSSSSDRELPSARTLFEDVRKAERDREFGQPSSSSARSSPVEKRTMALPLKLGSPWYPPLPRTLPPTPSVAPKSSIASSSSPSSSSSTSSHGSSEDSTFVKM